MIYNSAPRTKKIVRLLQFFLFAMIGLVSFKMTAQQESQYTQYMYNTTAINPAYAGSLGTLDVVGTYRDQWIGLDGAPVTQNLGIHAPLRNDRIGLGLNIQNETIGPAKEFNAVANFSYTIRVSPNTKLAFGLGAGVNLYDLDFSKGLMLDPNDKLLMNNIDQRVTPVIGAGTYLYGDKWYLGLSVPDFKTDELYDDIEQSIAEEEIQYYLMGGYVFDLNPRFKFKPAFLVKYQTDYPFVVDVSANFLYNERFTLGVSYRYEDAVSGLAGIEIFQGFFVGYSYDYTLTDLTNYNSGSHEIVLRFTLPSKLKRINSPRFF
ncbi:type IX secretion system membrane protein PorP/SprF [Marixanthomonas sp. SCSIO 43207]|uniref:PorP/SprF family type IX secretion system membrane protein n=1 Tax=Marixanthomonas sp. SCSIO 43207 TaxID=2779360 RepID=UPI001CAA36EF|nr:type IX secretion system membrane protein PorP/SprF [Marixanthomonas sp. SCSIO 43207]UAB80949.1 type IX secretion system membrane protein PorP/SprF [Marixanthomonas sp. SCSIO 43207]